MTRQEFAATVVAVQAEEPGAMLRLWEGVRRFVAKAAYRWVRNSNGRTPHEDLMQAGFIAMMDAVEKFDPERDGGGFLAVLRFTLKNRFAEESGIRTTRRDALQYAESADAPAYEDGPTIEDTAPDRSAALAFVGVEYGDFLDYCRRIIGVALDGLTPTQAAIVRQHYLNGLTLEDVASMYGQSSKQAAKEAEERALDRLAHGKYRRELRECLDGFEDFRADTWSTTGSSRTETAALRNIEKEGMTV